MKSAFLVVLLAPILFAQDQTGRITGTVTDTISRQPVSKARVNVIPAGNRRSGQQFASTDANGAFSLSGMAEGPYILVVTHENYAQPGGPASVQVKAGEETSATIEIVPSPTVTGRVVDEDGDPMRGCTIRARPAARPDQDRGAGFSNENGEYRIRNLSAGKYFLSARCDELPFTPRPFSAGPDPPPSIAYPDQFFPLAPDLRSAQPITLIPGAEKSGVDFRMRPAPVVQVRGSFAGSDWRTATRGLSVLLVPATGGPQYKPATDLDPNAGTFDFHAVFPGSYDVVAFANAGSGEKTLTAIVRIEVKDRPVEVVLNPIHGADLNGAVILADDGSGKQIAFQQISIRLQNDLPIPGGGATNVKADGTFTIESVAASRFHLVVGASGVFAKSVWLGNTEITNGLIDLTSGAPQALRIVLSTNMAKINGTASPGANVVIWSDDNSRNYSTGVDPTGHFSYGGIAPGKYRVCPDLPGIPPSEDSCTEITVHEGETATVDLKPPSVQ